jgi:Raf kinase inhibitor-like YbhB/YbcL family protein
MGTWVHWVLYNLPPDSPGLPGGLPPEATLADGSRQGMNDFDRAGYGGPCPPRGRPHRYFFKIYALDTTLELEGVVTKKKLERAMKGHVLGQGQLIGTYGRSS